MEREGAKTTKNAKREDREAAGRGAFSSCFVFFAQLRVFVFLIARRPVAVLLAQLGIAKLSAPPYERG